MLFKLSSADRSASESVGSHSFVLRAGDAPEWNGTYRLVEALMPSTQYTISSSNNVIRFNESGVGGGGSLTATVPPGYYTASSLAVAVGTVMTTASGGYNTYTAATSSLTGLLTITATVGGNFFMENGTDTAIRDPISTEMSQILGYPYQSSTTAAMTQTGTKPMNLSRIISFNILIDEANSSGGNRIISSRGGTTLTFSIPVLTNSGGIFHYKPVGNALMNPQEMFLKRTRVLRIKVIDDQGNLVDLNNVDWWILLSHDVGKP